MQPIIDRLRDPGTLRSIIWSLVGVIGLPQTDANVDAIAAVAMIVLGIVSAAMKPKNVVVAPPQSTVVVETNK